MISNDTKKQKDASSPVIWFGNLPRPIRPDDGVDSRLACFPANLLHSQIADPETDRETAKFLLMMCAFDPAKLLGDKQLCSKVRAVWYFRLNAHEVGRALTSLGFTNRKRTNAGFILWLDLETRKRIHKMAHNYGIDHESQFRGENFGKDCELCKNPGTSDSTHTETKGGSGTESKKT